MPSDKECEKFVTNLAADIVNLITARVAAFGALEEAGLGPTAIYLVLASQNAAALQRKFGRAPTVNELLQFTLNENVFRPMCELAIRSVLPILDRMKGAS